MGTESAGRQESYTATAAGCPDSGAKWKRQALRQPPSGAVCVTDRRWLTWENVPEQRVGRPPYSVRIEGVRGLKSPQLHANPQVSALTWGPGRMLEAYCPILAAAASDFGSRS
jgi:hypothetical protein